MRDYILPHTKCVKCSIEFNQTTNSELTESAVACEHRFVLERNTVLTHLENFLSDMQQRRGDKMSALPHRGTNALGTNTTISRLIDPADIQLFWKSYETFLPHETESLWNIIENGLNKYLLVSVAEPA